MRFPRTLQAELDRALRNPWFLVSLTVAITLVLLHSIDRISQFAPITLDPQEWLGLTSAGCFNTWIVTDASNVAPYRALFFLLLPLLATIPHAWSLGSDQRSGYAGQMLVRTSRASYLGAKAGATFISAALVAAIPLLVDLLMLACFLPAYTPDVTELMVGIGQEELWSELFFTEPLRYVICNVLLAMTLCGLWATLVMALSPLLGNRALSLVVPYAGLWTIQYLNDVTFELTEVRGFMFNPLGTPCAFGMGWPRFATPILLELLVIGGIAALLLRRGRGRDLL